MGACCAVTNIEKRVFMDDKEMTEEENRKFQGKYEKNNINIPRITVKEESKESSSNKNSIKVFLRDREEIVEKESKILLSEELKRRAEKEEMEKEKKERKIQREKQVSKLREFKKSLDHGQVIQNTEKLLKIAFQMLNEDCQDIQNQSKSPTKRVKCYDSPSNARKKLAAIKTYTRREQRAITQNNESFAPEFKEEQSEMKIDSSQMNLGMPSSPQKGLLKRSRTSSFYDEARRRERRAKKVKFQDLEYMKAKIRRK